MQTPMSPSSASFGTSSCGKRCSVSHAVAKRRDLGVGELAGDRLDLALLRGELEVHRRRIVGAGRSCPREVV